MNPVLLKPQSEIGAQLVVGGRVRGNVRARAYQALKGELLSEVLASFERLAAGADLVLVEGAGSPAEVNLRAGDIANMGFAEATGVPVALIGDIDRGGVIASLCGTVALLGEGERGLLAGYVVNKFRGDARLFDDGLRIIGSRTGLGCFGVVPYCAAAARLPAEDAASLPPRVPRAGAALRVVVPRLSRIANFDDLDPLLAEPEVGVEFIEPGCALPGDADLVILPGSKSTRADLEFLRAQGWDIDLAAHVRRGGWVLGLCAGFQMLGHAVRDRQAREGGAGSTAGLGLLDIETELGAAKTLRECRGVDPQSGMAVHGYEMHMGRSSGAGLARPMLEIGGHPHGAVSADGRVLGCYLHGLFSADAFRHAFMRRVAHRAIEGVGFEAQVEAALDTLADHLETHLDCDALLAAAGNLEPRLRSPRRPPAARPAARSH